MNGKNNLKALTSLALLSTPIFKEDYLSTFLPFFATLVIKKKYKKIDIFEVVRDFKEEYGLYIPRAPMQSILSRAVQGGLIELRSDGRYYPILSKLQEYSFAAKAQQEEQKLDYVVHKLVKFLDDKYNIKCDNQMAGEYLIDFFNEFSPSGIPINDVESRIAKLATQKGLYLVARFIKYSAEYDYEVFELIQELSFAFLIVIAMSFDEPIDGRIKGLSNLTIYLDTKVVFRLLGLESDELKDAYIELFKTYREYLSPEFKIFTHTMDEMLGILNDCAKWINNPGYNAQLANPALLAFVKRNYSESQIKIYINKFEEELSKHGISVDDDRYYTVVNNSKQIDEEFFKSSLVKVYREHNPTYDEHKNMYTLQNDVHSIANIVKLWGDRSARAYSNLGYLFLTSNSSLAYVSRRYTDKYWWDGKMHSSPCLTDYYLGTMIWLSTPANKMKNVSKLKLLADCSAATNLSKNVIDKFMVELEKLKDTGSITSEDYLLLRNEGFKNNYLQELTLNEETAYTDDIPEIILDKIKGKIKQPLIEEIKQLKRENGLKTEKLKEYEENDRLEESRKMNIETNATLFATKISKVIENIVIPLFTASFGVIAYYFGEYRLEIGGLTFFAVLLLGILKCNAFNMHDKLERIIYKWYMKFVKIKGIIAE